MFICSGGLPERPEPIKAGHVLPRMCYHAEFGRSAMKSQNWGALGSAHLGRGPGEPLEIRPSSHDTVPSLFVLGQTV